MTLPFTPSDWIASAAAIIAVCALGVSIWQGWLQRRHNILSVTPHLELVVDGTPPSEVVIVVKNSGLGPARLESVVANVKGESISLNSRESYFRFVAALAASGKAKVEYSVADVPSIIAAGADIQLLRIALTEGVAPSKAELRESLAQTNFALEFRCMYGRKYKC